MAERNDERRTRDKRSRLDQSDIEAYLANPETHGGASVERFDTHAAVVFVAGGHAYKIKRAVRYPYLDFSTLELRHAALGKELRINRRTAPDLYLGVQPLLRTPDGGIRFGQPEKAKKSEIAEWVLVMRAFDQDGLFDHLARRGRLSADLLTALADEIRRFHQDAERIGRDGPARGGVSGMRETVDENDRDIAERPDLFPANRAKRLSDASHGLIDRCAPLLEARWDRGFVRHCHGDLHLRNICLIDDKPTLFDAIEFNDAIACIDVLYDLAFLLMDLDVRGLRWAANVVFNRYLQDGAELEAIAALPLFLSVRAAIRAKVAATTEAGQADQARRKALAEEARHYFDAAEAYLDPPRPLLVAVGGLSGSGKSTLARRLAPHMGAAPGALVLRSDVIRKSIFDIDETEPLPERAYRAEVTGKVYAVMLERAETLLQAGQSVVLDAVHGKPKERMAAEALARRLAVPFRGFWLEADLDTLVRRTAARRGDASDATPDVVRAQARRDVGPMSWQWLDTARPLEQVLDETRHQLAEV